MSSHSLIGRHASCLVAEASGRSRVVDTTRAELLVVGPPTTRRDIMLYIAGSE